MFEDKAFYIRNFKERNIEELRKIYKRHFLKKYGICGDYVPGVFSYNVEEEQITLSFDAIHGKDCWYGSFVGIYSIGEAAHELWPEVEVTGGGSLCCYDVTGELIDCRITAKPNGFYFVEDQYECVVCHKIVVDEWFSDYDFLYQLSFGSDRNQCLCSAECASDFINSVENKAGKFYDFLNENSDWFDEGTTVDEFTDDIKSLKLYKETKQKYKTIML